MSQYDNESYLAGISASRASVEQQVANAIAEIQRQAQVGQTQVGLAAGAQEQAFSQSRGQYDEGFQGIGGALTGTLGRLAPSTAMDGTGAVPAGLLAAGRQAFLGAMGTQQEGFTKANEALSQGFAEQGVQRTGKATQLKSTLLSDLDAKRSEYISKREAEDRQRAFEEEQRRQQYQQALALQQAALAQQAQQAAAQRAWEQQQAEQNRAWLMAASAQSNPGVNYSGGNIPQVSILRPPVPSDGIVRSRTGQSIGYAYGGHGVRYD